MRLDGKVCVVTGSGSGQGRAAALRFAEEGAAVVIAEVEVETGAPVADEITAAGGAGLFVQTDVSSEEDWRRVIGQAVEAFGGVDVIYYKTTPRSPPSRTDRSSTSRWRSGTASWR